MAKELILMDYSFAMRSPVIDDEDDRAENEK
jgi:hypothetical protein